MVKEFKEFISKGNLVEIAVGLILALAFAGLVTSFTENLINPIIGAIFGQPNFDSLVIGIGDAELRYGAFLTTLLNFVIVAFVLFLVIKAYNRTFPQEGVRRSVRARSTCSPRSETNCGAADSSRGVKSAPSGTDTEVWRSRRPPTP